MLRAAGAMLTWRRTAHELKDLYADAIATSARDSRSLVADLAGLSSTARGLTTDGGRHAYAMALVGPDGALPARDGQAAAGAYPPGRCCASSCSRRCAPCTPSCASSAGSAATPRSGAR